MPKLLIEEIKQNYVDICHQLLSHYDREKENFLNVIVTGDKTYVHHYNIENKIQSMEFIH